MKLGDSTITGKENQGYYTPQKTVLGNKIMNVLHPLDTNIVNLPSDVNAWDSPIIGCVSKDVTVKNVQYRESEFSNIVCNRKPLTSKEKAIAMHCMYDDGVDEDKVLFMYKDVELCRYDLMSLRRGCAVQPSIINAWSIILNNVAIIEHSEKPVRFFASADIYIDCIFDTGMTYASRQRAFLDAMNREMRLYQSNDIGAIDMFFFPVFPSEHPYVIYFDIRKELMFILDSSVILNQHPVGSSYDILCDMFL
ncbi:uncharacterized protein LOC131002318 [Salvia miltiorrhiza]|uniref:uncharacterized protein LOC131002318 n=1 Tax=Salvia miltiorrhiza TaxID=226208 RepID=UPI0025ACC8BC|nr:uncharacterized protein LOC131002318 [Salvia miltiorrhiza]